MTYHDDILDETHEPRHLSYASFFQRFVAALLDALILAIPLSILSFIFGSFLDEFLQFGIVVLYNAAFESSPSQATPGKQIMNIRVTNLYGEPINLVNAMARNASKYLSALILLIGYIMAAFTERKQALHDIIAKTLVVEN